MKIKNYLLSMILLLLLLSGCSTDGSNEKMGFNLSQDTFTVSRWEMDNSHIQKVEGKLLIGEKAVQHAEIQIADKRTLQTDENGEFSFLVDQSIISKIPLSIISLDKATLAGQKIDTKTADKLKSMTSEVNVIYPIQITKVEESKNGADLVKVHGQVLTQEGTFFPKFAKEKYAIYGTIKDSNGNPVENAVVSVTRYGWEYTNMANVEGFSSSLPSNERGEYILYHNPEDDEDAYFHVIVGNTDYELPDQKVFRFQDDTSMIIDITLPKEGTVITDEAPYLIAKTAPGALYKGLVLGLSVNENVDYTITLPDNDGSFVLTLPKTEWEKSPDFYITKMSKFLLEDLKPGELLQSTSIPKPTPFEPNHIKAKLS